jgi:hypothetical protein
VEGRKAVTGGEWLAQAWGVIRGSWIEKITRNTEFTGDMEGNREDLG